MAKSLKVELVEKGGFVKGHRVAVYSGPDLPVMQGEIQFASKTGGHVVLRLPDFSSVFGLPVLSRWTWREKEGCYQKRGTRTRRGFGLALITTPKGKGAE